ncbi:MAG: thiamine-phosphate synthase family protein [Candidatus Verstraetearchaeota archaeon]|nr:thiamine-phosphate synthase family protein [Candidatus Verstraetearchaeota archaeon]
MNPPCELTVRELLPVLRTLIAKELAENHGYTQTKIAKKLGVTQAAVSGYLTQEVTDATVKPFDIKELSEIAKNFASEITMKRFTHSDMINNICEICLNLRRGGSICHAHRLKIQELEDEKCSICMQLHMSLTDISDMRRGTLSDLTVAVSMIENTPEFVELEPQVLSNLVMAIKNAKGVADVAGIPGRLVKIRGKVMSLMDPEFGVSSHLAKLVLRIMNVNPEARSAINTAYNEKVADAIKRMGFSCAVFERTPAQKGEEELFDFAEKAFREGGGWVDVVVDAGGIGIEPNAYFFEKNALRLADRIVRVARLVSARKNQK